MYRARIDSVSGTKVYADGKWLSCIGNKNHRVGDYVWTDGRCAYGHFQESQQPQVIIAPDDEGIPIYAVDRNHLLYTFQKNKLKKVDELERPKVIPDGWSKVRLINDKHRVFTHKYLASNIDSHGNIFVMAEVYKLDDDNFYTEAKVVIFKEDKTKSELAFNKVKEIDLLDFLEKNVVSKCPDPDIPFADCLLLDSGGVTIGDACPIIWDTHYSITRAFIQDDNNFEIFFFGSISKDSFAEGYGYDAMPIAHSAYEADILIKTDGKNDGSELLRAVTTSAIRDGTIYTVTEKESDAINPPGMYATFYINDVYQDGKWTDLAYHKTESETNNTVKFSVGDGFYGTLHWERYPYFVETNTKAAGGEYRYHFFSPDNTEIADIHANLRFKILFRKVKGKYLVLLYGIPFKIYKFFEAEGEIDRLDAFSGYLYSIANKTLTPLDDAPACSNDRLRPMTNIKRWHKRIKEIVLDLDDKEEN